MPKRGRDDEEEEPRSSKRVKLPPLNDYLEAANKAQQEIEYKRSLISAYAGSAKAVAYLGPLSVRSVNSDADSSKPSGIIAARKKYPSAYFKAGHMINAMFGGNGERCNNLTILTGSTNTSMTAYDNRVRDAVLKLCKLFETFHSAKIALNDIGECRIKLRVEVSGDKWGDKPPDSYICNQVITHAEFKNVPADRSGYIQDTDRAAGHVRTINRLQNEITNLTARGCGRFVNDY